MTCCQDEKVRCEIPASSSSSVELAASSRFHSNLKHGLGHVRPSTHGSDASNLFTIILTSSSDLRTPILLISSRIRCDRCVQQSSGGSQGIYHILLYPSSYLLTSNLHRCLRIGRSSCRCDHGSGRVDGSVHEFDGHWSRDRAHSRPTLTGRYADELGSSCWMSIVGEVLRLVRRWRGWFLPCHPTIERGMPGGSGRLN